MKLTKSEYLSFLECDREFWLRRRKPELFVRERTVQDDYMRRMGYQVQALAKQMFMDGDFGKCHFEKPFETDLHYCRCDVFAEKDGENIIYEVKGSKSVKPEHLADLAFQKAVAEFAGTPVGQTFVVHLNGDYVRRGDIEPDKLFTVTETTADIDGMLDATRGMIAGALAFLDTEPPATLTPFCANKLGCEFLRFHFKDLPTYSIFDIANFRGKKFDQLVADNILDIMHVPADLELTGKQRLQVNVAQSGTPHIARDEMREIFSGLEFPLYFLDYETSNPAVPVYDGYRPFQNIVFQFSLHVMTADGACEHREFLSNGDGEPILEFLKALKGHIAADGGTVIVWSSYEISKNKEMGERYPEFEPFLASVKERTFDLMTVFSKGHYVHPKFKGSTSIKKVLPALMPEKGYGDLAIQDGLTASAAWIEMVFGSQSPEEKDGTRSELLEYCGLDTEAMVDIWKFLQRETA
jgi:hypothetical protein